MSSPVGSCHANILLECAKIAKERKQKDKSAKAEDEYRDSCERLIRYVLDRLTLNPFWNFETYAEIGDLVVNIAAHAEHGQAENEKYQIHNIQNPFYTACRCWIRHFSKNWKIGSALLKNTFLTLWRILSQLLSLIRKWVFQRFAFRSFWNYSQ